MGRPAQEHQRPASLCSSTAISPLFLFQTSTEGLGDTGAAPLFLWSSGGRVLNPGRRRARGDRELQGGAGGRGAGRGAAAGVEPGTPRAAGGWPGRRRRSAARRGTARRGAGGWRPRGRGAGWRQAPGWSRGDGCRGAEGTRSGQEASG